MAVNGINSPLDIATVANGANSTAYDVAAKDSAKEISDRFMALLVAQVKNQDPLSPMDNAQMTSQMAQISTVTGVNQLNETMKWLGFSMSSLQATQAAGLIGRDILSPGNSLELQLDSANNPISTIGGFYTPIDVVKGQIDIINGSGEVVRTIQLTDAELKTGIHDFVWNGLDNNGVAAAPGKYMFQVTQNDGKTDAKVNTLAFSKVVSVLPDPSGTQVIDSKGNRVNLVDVMQVF